MSSGTHTHTLYIYTFVYNIHTNRWFSVIVVVNRDAVLQATKVRSHLKQDGSWINRSQTVQDTQSDVKAW